MGSSQSSSSCEHEKKNEMKLKNIIIGQQEELKRLKSTCTNIVRQQMDDADITLKNAQVNLYPSESIKVTLGSEINCLPFLKKEEHNHTIQSKDRIQLVNTKIGNDYQEADEDTSGKFTKITDLADNIFDSSLNSTDTINLCEGDVYEYSSIHEYVTLDSRLPRTTKLTITSNCDDSNAVP